MLIRPNLSASDNRRIQAMLLGNQGGFAIPRAGLAASFDAALGITSSGGFASAWADQSGNGRNLLQATGANQPIHLPFAGTKYGWLSGEVGNRFSTPDSVAATPTGNAIIQLKMALQDWSPAAITVFVDKYSGAGYSYQILSDNGGTKWHFSASVDGVAVSDAAFSISIPFAANADGWVQFERSASTGSVVMSYRAGDNDPWIAVGSPQPTTPGALYNNTAPLGFGGFAAAFPAAGKIYIGRIYNDGNLAVDFDPSRWTSGATFTASTGEEWTINSTGSKPAQIVDKPSLLFDGAAHFMKTDPFTLNQPTTMFLVMKQVSWTINDQLTDGNTPGTLAIFQNSATPELALYAGAVAASNTNLAVGAKGVICAQFNGASSLLQANQTTAATGNAGASNAGGICLGAASNPAAYANIQAYELLAYSAALDAATRANVMRALMSKHGVA